MSVRSTVECPFRVPTDFAGWKAVNVEAGIETLVLIPKLSGPLSRRLRFPSATGFGAAMLREPREEELGYRKLEVVADRLALRRTGSGFAARNRRGRDGVGGALITGLGLRCAMLSVKVSVDSVNIYSWTGATTYVKLLGALKLMHHQLEGEKQHLFRSLIIEHLLCC